MRIKVRQNYRGRYNLCSNEESLSFIMDIVDEDSKTIECNGIKARLQLDKDMDPFEEPESDICNIYNECWDYAKSVWSTTPYKEQCLTFAKIFQENYEELCKNRIQDQTEWISKEIERLQNKAKYLYGFDDISYEVNKGCNLQIATYERFIENNLKEIEQLKRGSEKYEKLIKTNLEYQQKIDYYNSCKIEECYYE